MALHSSDYIWAFMLAAVCGIAAWLHVMLRIFQAWGRRADVEFQLQKHAPEFAERFDTSLFRGSTTGKISEIGLLERMDNQGRLQSFINSDELDEVAKIRQAKEECREAVKRQKAAFVICVATWAGSMFFLIVVMILDVFVG